MYKSHQGWYTILNPEKFILPIDEHMKSHKNGAVNYKSGLELKAIRYCDYNKFVKKWSLEPFCVKYIKPCTGKEHRYYIDLYIEFNTGDKVLVEVKSKSETTPPKKPLKTTKKSTLNYQKALLTFSTNSAKWKAASIFAKNNGMQFTIITEKELS